MPLMSVMWAYMAPQPFLPLASALAVLCGVVLLFGRSVFSLIARWVRPDAVRRSRD